MHDDEHGRQVDVFAGTFEMCHVIPVADRLDRHAVTVPLAELLLTKLQIVELNRKDLVDAGALLVSQPVVTSGADGIEGDVIAELCARDWGLWRTCTMNLRRVDEHLPELGVAPETAATISARVAELQRQIDEAPKTRGWRIRSRVGDRVRWYHEPDEVDEG